MTLTFKLDIGADYTYANLILVELNPLYTGIPICEYKGNGETDFNIYKCSLSNGILTFNLGN